MSELFTFTLAGSGSAQTPYAEFVNVPVSSTVAYNEEFSVSVRLGSNGDNVMDGVDLSALTSNYNQLGDAPTS